MSYTGRNNISYRVGFFHCVFLSLSFGQLYRHVPPPSRLWPPLVEWRLAVGDEGTFFFFFFPLLLLDLLDDGTTLSYEKEILRPHVLRATNQQAYGEGGGNWEADIEVTGGSLFLCLLSTIRGSSHQKERLGFFFSFLILPLDRVFFFSPPSVLIVFLVTFSGA